MRSVYVKVCVMLAVATMLCTSTAVADVFWTGTTGSFTDGTNWDTGTRLDSSSWAMIDNGGTAQITAGVDATAKGLFLGYASGSGNLTMDGGTLTTTNGIVIGRLGAASVEGAHSHIDAVQP